MENPSFYNQIILGMHTVGLEANSSSQRDETQRNDRTETCVNRPIGKLQNQLEEAL